MAPRLQLEGVLFFGNAEDLSLRVKELLKSTQMVVLDFRKVTDIDVSGANILASLVAKAKQQARIVVFCSVPPSVNSAASRAFGTDAQRIEFVRPDLDSALEYIEGRAIRELGPVQSEIQLGEVDLIAGLPKNDVETLRGFLVYRRFDPGEHLCEQGDAGDRMWLLVLGSVSVRNPLRVRSTVPPDYKSRSAHDGRRNGTCRKRAPLHNDRSRFRRGRFRGGRLKVASGRGSEWAHAAQCLRAIAP